MSVNIELWSGPRKRREKEKEKSQKRVNCDMKFIIKEGTK